MTTGILVKGWGKDYACEFDDKKSKSYCTVTEDKGDVTMKCGNKALKISLIQTLPGAEPRVVERLRENCRVSGINDYHIMKGFGAFDIVLLYASNNFDPVLAKAGPVDGILKTTRSYCFHHELDKDISSLFRTLEAHDFTALSLVKINPLSGKPFHEIELNILSNFPRYQSNNPWFAFGSLGWNELLILQTGNDINAIANDLYWSLHEDLKPYVYKTYSFLTLDYKLLPSPGDTEPEAIIRFINSSKRLIVKIDANIAPAIAITTLPVFSGSVVDYWQKLNYKVLDLIGKEDILVEPPKDELWSNFLINLLSFRYQYKNKLLATHTYIQKNPTQGSLDDPSFASSLSLKVEHDYDTLVRSFDRASAGSLTSSLNTLHGLFQNNIIGDAFIDMANFPSYVVKVGPKIQDEEKRINFALQADELIKRGAELRINGTHGTLDEAVGQFTKLRGGTHRSLLALGYLPSSVFSRVFREQKPWQGFIIAGSSQFYNLNDVINVPTKALWTPELWWATYHEVAHMLINNLSGAINYDLPEIKMFLTKKNYHDYWFRLLVEITAEFIGYEIGFFGNYELFLKRVWTYIYSLYPGLTNLSQLGTYVVRTFSVKLIEDIIYKNIVVGTRVKDEVIFDELIAHMEMIEKVIYDVTGNNVKFKDKYFIAANYAPIWREMAPWIEKYLKEITIKLKLRPSVEYITNKNTQDIAKSIEKGVPWYQEILYPEAIYYLLMEKRGLAFDQQVATILTFCSAQKTNLEKVMYAR